MKKTMLVMMMVIALVMGTMAAALAGSASKATGSGTWSNAWGAYYGEFNAHEEVVGKNVRPAKGHVYQERTDADASMSVNVTDVVVGADWACFWGPIYAATGEWAGWVDDTRWTFVTDGGEPGAGEWRGGAGAPPSACLDGTLRELTAAFTGGNVTIHTGEAHQ